MDVTCSGRTVGIALNGVHIRSQFDELRYDSADSKQCLPTNNNQFPYTVTELAGLGDSVYDASVTDEATDTDWIRSGGNTVIPITNVKGNSCPISKFIHVYIHSTLTMYIHIFNSIRAHSYTHTIYAYMIYRWVRRRLILLRG